MKLNFKSWIESFIPFEKTQQIQKGLKNYEPGTFGVELEFICVDFDDITMKLSDNTLLHDEISENLNEEENNM